MLVGGKNFIKNMSHFLRETFAGLSQQKQLIVAGVAGLTTAGVVCSAAWWYRRQTSLSKILVFKPVGKLSSIWIHPIKSCRGYEVSSAECMPWGLQGNGLFDRHFIVLSAENTMISLRTEPTLALLLPSISDDGCGLTLEAPGMDPLNVSLANITEKPVLQFRLWRLNSEGYYCGQEVETWLSDYLQKPGCKLAYFKKGLNIARRPREDSKWGDKFTSKDEVCGYSDFAQFMILTDASLVDLNSRLEKPASMRNFRPNLVVSGADAYDEDKWKYVKIGNTVTFRRSHACGRCKLTTVDPEAGVMNTDNEPLQTLLQYRLLDKSDSDSKAMGNAPVFGSNLICAASGTLCVGDTVYAAV